MVAEPKSVTEKLVERARAYEQEGHDESHAFNLAALDMHVDHWPSGWGDDFVALIFGDFDPPDEDIVFDQLRITIEHEKVENTVVRSARTVLKARVAVPDKSVAAVKDAAKRLNLLSGVLSYTNQGAPIRWWSYITHQWGGFVCNKLGYWKPDAMLALVQLLPERARKKTTAALYWMREPRNTLIEHTRGHHLAVYAGYWNAFELLVDAANFVVPLKRQPRDERTQLVRERVREAGDSIGLSDIAAMYREVVDPGLRRKAEHALAVCTGADAPILVKECFDHEPSDYSLYAIRNSINHGTVDVDDPETAMLVEERFPMLSSVVRLTLNGLLRINLRKVAG